MRENITLMKTTVTFDVSALSLEDYASLRQEIELVLKARGLKVDGFKIIIERKGYASKQQS